MSEILPVREPVLVVHGIGTRDQSEFEVRVRQFGAVIGPRFTLIPVHWGELAGSTLHLPSIMAGRPAPPTKPLGKPPEAGLWGKWLGEVGGFIDTRMQAADAGLLGLLRAGVTNNIVPYLGDVIVYQGMREQFHRTVRSYLPAGYGTFERPIKAIGHSLGGVMLFDLAVSTQGTPVWFSHLVTLGSQPSFFHLQHRRSDAVREYAGQPVTLPPMIREWTNVLDDDDWLSFAVEPIFRLAGGGKPTDRWVDNTAGGYTDVFTLAAHSGYWSNPEVHAILKEAFAE